MVFFNNIIFCLLLLNIIFTTTTILVFGKSTGTSFETSDPSNEEINILKPDQDLFPQEDLRDVPIFHSINGKLEVDFNLRRPLPEDNNNENRFFYGNTDITTGSKDPYMYEATWQGKTYITQFPGPTFKLNIGDKLIINVENSLNGTHPYNSGVDPDALGKATHTSAEQNEDLRYTSNIHFHGLYVPDKNQGDNVFRAITPNEDGKLKVIIPILPHQPKGWFWYHAHLHTQVTDQVYGGLAGAIQIGDPLHIWPKEKKLVKQKNMVISLVNIDKTTTSESESSPSLLNSVQGFNAALQNNQNFQYYVNGQPNPIVYMTPGETQVYNLVNTSPQGFISMCITGEKGTNPFTGQILVMDGQSDLAGQTKEPVHPFALTYSCTRERNFVSKNSFIWLSQGGRRTISVIAPKEEGTYYLSTGFLPGGKNWPNTYAVLTIVVKSNPDSKKSSSSALPSPVIFPKVGDYDINTRFLETPDVYREFEYNNQGRNFFINGKQFPFGQISRMECGSLEEWLNMNTGNGAPHTFHIHQDSYLVTKQNGILIDSTCSSDICDFNGNQSYISQNDITVFNKKEDFTFRYRVPDFPGKLVIHCHILFHEDHGMMTSLLFWRPIERYVVPLIGLHGEPLLMNGDGNTVNIKKDSSNILNKDNLQSILNNKLSAYKFEGFQLQKQFKKSLFLESSYGHGNTKYVNYYDVIATGDSKKNSRINVYHQLDNEKRFSLKSSFDSFTDQIKDKKNTRNNNKNNQQPKSKTKKKSGTSVAVGHLNHDTQATIAVTSHIKGTCHLKLFDEDGNQFDEIKDAFGDGKILPHGCNVAIGDVNGDNFDDIILGANKGAPPNVIALSGQTFFNKQAPEVIVAFRASGSDNAGVNIAAGYVAQNPVEFNTNILTTPIKGDINQGVVEVWAKNIDLTVSLVTSFKPFENVPTIGKIFGKEGKDKNQKKIKNLPLKIKAGYYGHNLQDASAVFTYYLQNEIAITTITSEYNNVSTTIKYFHQNEVDDKHHLTPLN